MVFTFNELSLVRQTDKEKGHFHAEGWDKSRVKSGCFGTLLGSQGAIVEWVSEWCLSWDLSLNVSEPDKKGVGEGLQTRGPMCAKEGELGQSRELSFSMAGRLPSSGRIGAARLQRAAPWRALCIFSWIWGLMGKAVRSHCKVLNEGWGKNEVWRPVQECFHKVGERWWFELYERDRFWGCTVCVPEGAADQEKVCQASSLWDRKFEKHCWVSAEVKFTCVEFWGSCGSCLTGIWVYGSEVRWEICA